MKSCQTPASAWQPLWVWTTAETIRKSTLCWRRTSGRLPHALRVCSIEALFTRIAKGKGMPHINPVVDLGNAISLKYTLPLGAHDLGDAGDDIQVRLSRPGDTFLPFGSTKEEAPDAGEVVYAVGSQVRTRRWTWRQSEHGKIEAGSSSIFFPIDGFSNFNKETVMEARDELSRWIARLFSCQVWTGFVDRDHPEMELPFSK